jgi:hypothetical protein
MSAAAAATPEDVITGHAFCLQCGKTDVVMQRCSICHLQRYCSVECQKCDWKLHKLSCEALKGWPLELCVFPGNWRKRGVVASRDIKMGETVISEKPSLLVRTASITVQTRDDYKSFNAAEAQLRSFIGEQSPKKLLDMVENSDNDCDTVWLLVDTALSTKEGNVNWTQSRLRRYARGRPDANVKSSEICKYLQKKHNVSANQICRIFSLLSTNHFFVDSLLFTTANMALAFYDFASFFNHSCTANLGRYFKNGKEMVLVAARDIRSGESLTINYGSGGAMSGQCLCGDCHVEANFKSSVLTAASRLPAAIQETFTRLDLSPDDVSILQETRTAINHILIENGPYSSVISARLLQRIGELLTGSVGGALKNGPKAAWKDFQYWVWDTCLDLGERFIQADNVPVENKFTRLLTLTAAAMFHGAIRPDGVNKSVSINRLARLQFEVFDKDTDLLEVFALDSILNDRARTNLILFSKLFKLCSDDGIDDDT